MKYVNIIKEQLDEATDATLKQIGDAIKGKDFMDLREPLEAIFKKKDVDFGFEGAPHYTVKVKGGKKVMLVNKKYVSSADLTVGDVAIGYM
jgi:hypothetical protein